MVAAVYKAGGIFIILMYWIYRLIWMFINDVNGFMPGQPMVLTHIVGFLLIFVAEVHGFDPEDKFD